MNVRQSHTPAAPGFNIANVLTVLRILLVPVFIWAFWNVTITRMWLAFGIFALAALTDKIDGYLARKLNLITDFGKIADSMADKFLISAALIMLSLHGMLWWWVTILMIAREAGISIMRLMLVKKEVMAAKWMGKLKMVAQSVGVAGLLIPWYSFLPHGVASGFFWLSTGLVLIALVLSLWSAVNYIRDGLEVAGR